MRNITNCINIIEFVNKLEQTGFCKTSFLVRHMLHTLFAIYSLHNLHNDKPHMNYKILVNAMIHDKSHFSHCYDWKMRLIEYHLTYSVESYKYYGCILSIFTQPIQH